MPEKISMGSSVTTLLQKIVDAINEFEKEQNLVPVIEQKILRNTGQGEHQAETGSTIVLLNFLGGKER